MHTFYAAEPRPWIRVILPVRVPTNHHPLDEVIARKRRQWRRDRFDSFLAAARKTFSHGS
jgi:hypothetical protein